MKVAAKVELSSRVLNAAGVAMAGNLGIDAIQTLSCSHKSRDPDDGLIPEHPYLDLRPVLERRRNGCHPLFEKTKAIDRVTGVFDFMFQLEFDRQQSKALNDVPVQCPQKSVLEAACAQVVLTFRQNPIPISMMPDKVRVVSEAGHKSQE
jgi:hypothetical protein